MARRRRAIKRKVSADPLYKSTLLGKFINKIMLDGKKSVARTTVYGALDSFSKRVKEEDPATAFEKALENAMHSLEVKSRRIGGATYQVPVEIRHERRVALAMKWIVANSRSKPGKNMADSLSIELADCFNNQGATIKKKEDTHRMAEANKAFAQFKW